MSEGTRVFSTISGQDVFPSKLKEEISSTPAPSQNGGTDLQKADASTSPAHSLQSPSHTSPGHGSDPNRGPSSHFKPATPIQSPQRSLTPNSILNSKHLNIHSPLTMNGLPSHSTNGILDSQRSNPISVLAQVKARPSFHPTIKPGNGYTETIFQVPTPVPPRGISWTSEEHVSDGKNGNSNKSSPARVSTISSGTLPLENDDGRSSVGSSKTSLTNCLPLRLKSKTSPKSSPSKPGFAAPQSPSTPAREPYITGILKTPTRNANSSAVHSPKTTTALNSGLHTGPSDFSSSHGSAVFATTMTGQDILNTRSATDRPSESSPGGDKTSSVLLDSVNRLHIAAPHDIPDNRSVTFQTDQMSHVFSRFKALFDGGDPPPPDKSDKVQDEEISKDISTEKVRILTSKQNE